MILLVIVTGATIGWFGYHQASGALLAANDQLLKTIEDDVADDLRQQAVGNRRALARLARSALPGAVTLEHRLAEAPVLLGTLADHEHLDAVYAGYADGDFVLARPLRSDELRKQFDAPPEAAFALQAIDRTGDAVSTTHFYYDEGFQLVARRDAPDTDFDPRRRPWYAADRGQPGDVAYTPPYVFFTSREVGVTVSITAADSSVVVAADRTLADLSRTLARYRPSPSAEVVLAGADGRVLAHPETGRLVRHDPTTGQTTLARLAELGSPILAKLAEALPSGDQALRFVLDGRTWQGVKRAVHVPDGPAFHLAILAPEDELLADARRLRDMSVWLTVTTLLVTLPIAWLTSRMIATPLGRLASEARAIAEFDFTRPVTTRSVVLEIDQLATTMDSMKQTIRGFIVLSASLSAEHRFQRLLQRVIREAAGALQAAGGAIHLRSDDGAALQPGSAEAGGQPVELELFAPIPLEDATRPSLLAEAARSGALAATAVPDAPTLAEQLAAPRLVDRLADGAGQAVALPLRNRQAEVVGVLTLWTGPAAPARERLAFVEALAGVAAVAIENQRLLKAQKDLLDAFIKLIAGAIDAKSPYTGGHCQRVPVLTRMLAEAACASRDGPYADFALSDAEWEEIEIASWLHDCGKVTTPEFVVDKATKLETVYDRIHEVRMRFEVLKRDAEIDYWKALHDGADPAAARTALDARWRRLDDDFAFVASCNLGGEFMDEQHVTRLREIASLTWRRTLDDRLGISWEERQRKEREPARPLPADEPLLANRPEHRFEWGSGERIPDDNRWGFHLDVPDVKYDRGELHNLSVGRGTLTPEDRYKINDHIVQTILMLEQLPFPKGLRRVPEIAGGHHEKADGTGYPRRLRTAEQSVPARMMAIADIFEALTARDRPYKPGKTLSQAVGIMARMRDEGHVDPELFALFLTAGVHRRYAAQFLPPEQVDEVDVSRHLRNAG
jgi:HD-GYP domain-containing protein (c-di-GMP phosphodiesterase class II)